MDKNYTDLRLKAIKFRKQGLSYNEIKNKINVSKSTLSSWLKSVPLKPEHRERFYTKQIEILSRGSQSQKERRAREVEGIIKNAEKEIQLPLSFEAYRLMGAALYWAEGSKAKKFEMTNSDPHLILFFIHWVRDIFKISPKSLKATLNIYSQQDDAKLKKFWSDLTGIPLDNFCKSYIKPPNKGYKKNNLYYGTARIYVPMGTDTRHRVFGWIKSVLRNVDPKVQLTQKKWISLTNVSRPVNLKK